MIQLRNISKKYNSGLNSIQALDSVTLDIARGEAIAVLGPSGSGKSTMMDLVGTITTPDSGKYFFDNQDVSLMSDKEKACLRNSSIGFVFQAFHLLPALTIKDNVLLPLLYCRKKKESYADKASDALKAVGLGDRTDSLPKTLSGGEQQRVAIARSLILNPELILADEPTGNLDSKNGELIISILFEQWKKGSTLLMITHNENLAKLFPRIIRILDGRIIYDGAPEHSL